MTVVVKPNQGVEKLKNVLAEQKEPTSIAQIIQKASSELGKALPSHMSPERLVRIALTTIRLNPELSKCTPESFMGSLFTAAQLGLEPVAGRCYLLPFKNNRKVGNEWKSFSEVQLIVGFKGWIELFYRHEASLSLDVQEVCQNDFFEYELGTNAYIKHKPAKTNRGDVVDIYAIAKLKHGGTLFKVMSFDDCMEHGRLHSKTWDKKTGRFHEASPWSKEPVAMAKKTVLLQLTKLLPLSIEMQKAVSADETSRDFRSGIESALDLPVTTTWEETTEPQSVKNVTPVAMEVESELPEPGSSG